MTSVMENCDDTGMEHYDDKSFGALCHRAWRIVITGDLYHCDDKGMEHCDDRDHGTL